ncbi:hypothetical protein RFI_23020 [Reticulomyxa filosa]|uniref:Uncharacterized protein n=1 Tax=Reticulomyxa filosa TaxID=46433 RepID=X6ML50_RETFI|nr:hypothetical protein RFI_23020 [Reticulomyxa filosa]|eukprot:ETO14351.1 hypothetical protein RFI_23020 [Reticulomyxa filosa]
MIGIQLFQILSNGNEKKMSIKCYYHLLLPHIKTLEQKDPSASHEEREQAHTLFHHVYELMISNKMSAKEYWDTDIFNLFIRYNAICCKQKTINSDDDDDNYNDVLPDDIEIYLNKSIALVREMHQYGVALNCDTFNNLIRHCYEDDNDYLGYITEQLHVMMDNYNISPNEDTYLLLLEHCRKHNHVKVAERIIDELSDEKSLLLKNFKLAFVYLQIFEAHDNAPELIQQKLYRLCEAIPQLREKMIRDRSFVDWLCVIYCDHDHFSTLNNIFEFLTQPLPDSNEGPLYLTSENIESFCHVLDCLEQYKDDFELNELHTLFWNFANFFGNADLNTNQYFCQYFLKIFLRRHHPPSASFVYDDIRKFMSCGVQLDEHTIRQWLVTDPSFAANSTINNFVHYFNRSLHQQKQRRLAASLPSKFSIPLPMLK